jgi:hypothetical protein
MKNQIATIRILLLAGVALLLFHPSLDAQQSLIRPLAEQFLDSYVRGDQKQVLSMVDPEITMYGSDRSEFLHGANELSEMMRIDQLLWQKTARITDLCNFSEVSTGSLATLFFDATFTAGNRPPMPLRFATVWKKKHGKWFLVQSSNVVPTEHQSAAEILGASPTAH